MNVEQVRAAREAQPFAHFKLVLPDGTRVEVRHREMLSLTGGRMAVVYERTHRRVIDLMLVSALEFEEGQAAPQGSESVE